MRKLIFALFAILVCSLFFISCQKEVDGNIPNSPQSDSGYIDKIVGLDTTLPSGADTVETDFFSYDNSKRLIQLKAVIDNGNSVVEHNFQYSGSDSLPNKLFTKEVYGSISNTSDTNYYFYTNGVVTRDSIISWDNITGLCYGAIVYQYNISGNNVTRTERVYNYAAGTFVLISTDVCTLTVTFSSGNMATETLVSGSNTYQSVQASYDNKPNPVGRALKVRHREFDSYFWDDWILQNNNPLNIQYEEHLGGSNTDTYSYTYRSDGNPAVVRINSTTGSLSANKLLYFYKTL